jgi:putative redox protein
VTETAEPRITRTSLVHNGDLAFTARMPDGHEIVLDAGDSGPSPVEALLAGIGGCMAIDVVMILEKMRCPPSRFSMDLEAESAPTPPRFFRRVRMTLVLAGDGLDEAKVERAVTLSRDTYCSVLATMRPDLEVEIAWEIVETAQCPGREVRVTKEAPKRPGCKARGGSDPVGS